MGNKITGIYVGTHKVRPESPETVLTYDFQNDWFLNWVWTNIGYWVPEYITWEGWRLYRSNQDSEGRLTPPSSAYNNGTLIKIKMRIYKWFINHWDSARAYGVGAGVVCGNNRFCWSASWANINYDRIRYRANVSSDSFITTINYAWEATLELDVEWTTPILTINGSNTYTLTGSLSSEYQSYWSNKTLQLVMWNRRWGSGDIYVRKVEFTTI